MVRRREKRRSEKEGRSNTAINEQTRHRYGARNSSNANESASNIQSVANGRARIGGRLEERDQSGGSLAESFDGATAATTTATIGARAFSCACVCVLVRASARGCMRVRAYRWSVAKYSVAAILYFVSEKNNLAVQMFRDCP